MGLTSALQRSNAALEKSGAFLHLGLERICSDCRLHFESPQSAEVTRVVQVPVTRFLDSIADFLLSTLYLSAAMAALKGGIL
jgi:hypothetical protein